MRQYAKATRSGNGNCVEWAVERDGVHVRDSKDPAGPELRFTHAEWAALTAAAATATPHPAITPTPTTTTLTRAGRSLRFTPAEWSAFTHAAATGECARQPQT
ncbi:hypothetical protein GCM10010123_25810 [Pilimelia anulata]|uniref:DUF397 domain-containing protein n=1 Tax=Pilimelia anulata TaxID=53371 RepID=A0A8J3F9R0_9ACTN|nr:hypothetical protein GCM10010123_25810 [Pilimelia anulata]